MPWFMGIDIGSRYSKGVITRNREIAYWEVLPSGGNHREIARTLVDKLLARAGLTPDAIQSTISTGIGGGSVPQSAGERADIRCCAKGILSIFPAVRTVIDIGSMTSQVIRIDGEGLVTAFVASEKCATGSGRFLEVIANVLQVDLADIGRLALEAKNLVTLTTGCAVFGETEAISRVSEGFSREDILAGVHQALANKISALIDRIGPEERYAITGGGGLNIGLIKKLEDKLQTEVCVPPLPQFVTALGAAIMAEEGSPDT